MMSGLSFNTNIPGLGAQSSDGAAPSGNDSGGLSEFATGILNQIPEADREVVGRHLHTWDSGVTKKFAAIHDEYKPWKELGNINDVQNALSYIGLLNEDPAKFISLVQEAMKESGYDMSGYDGGDDYTPPPAQGQSGDNSNLPEWQGVPQGFVDEFRSMQKMMTDLTNGFTGYQNQQTEKEQMQQVDNLFKEMHNRHGEFDEDFVLMKMAAGMDPDAALASWNETITKYSNQRKPAPNLLGGSGSIPNGQVDLSAMSKAEKMSWAVQAIQNANSNT